MTGDEVGQPLVHAAGFLVHGQDVVGPCINLQLGLCRRQLGLLVLTLFFDELAGRARGFLRLVDGKTAVLVGQLGGHALRQLGVGRRKTQLNEKALAPGLYLHLLGEALEHVVLKLSFGEFEGVAFAAAQPAIDGRLAATHESRGGQLTVEPAVVPQIELVDAATGELAAGEDVVLGLEKIVVGLGLGDGVGHRLHVAHDVGAAGLDFQQHGGLVHGRGRQAEDQRAQQASCKHRHHRPAPPEQHVDVIPEVYLVVGVVGLGVVAGRAVLRGQASVAPRGQL